MDLDFLLIRKMRQGDEKAFDLFIHKYYRDILSYCNYHCVNKEYAEDLTQETFVRFFAKLSDYHHMGKVKNYLYIIARNLCVDYMKKIKEIPTEHTELVKQLERGTPENDTVLNRISLESALKKLPDELREVIVLYYFNELKITEIAKNLGITVSLVKYRLKRRKTRLKQLIGGEMNE